MVLGILELGVLVFFCSNHNETNETALYLFVHCCALKPLWDFCKDCFSVKSKPGSLKSW